MTGDGGIYTIPDYGSLPEGSCTWPACSTEHGFCPRTEAGTCPLDSDLILACSRCGCALGASSLKCPVCDQVTA
jgi:hypothetical protein